VTPSPARQKPNSVQRPLAAFFAGLFGGLLGLCLMKFGNPGILEFMVQRPEDVYQWIFAPWPVSIAHGMLLAVACVGLAVAKWKTRGIPVYLVALPAAWLLWEFAAGTQTLSSALTQPTLTHFTGCVICFYLGFFALALGRTLWPFWIGLLAGFLVVLTVGIQQHFGGLEETRRYFYLYEYSKFPGGPPPELLKKMSTNRIFSTLLYPNTLAGVILLILPALLAFLWSLQRQFTVGARRFLVGAVAVASLACLFWSGSKGGWLLMLIVGFVWVLFQPLKRQLKLAIISTVLILGLAGFALKYAGYFRRGATSVEARFDYWRVALRVVDEKPVFGTGPGTFAIPHERLKKPESEMARLVHNDYLEQASDSGVPGFLLYAALVVWCLVYAYRYSGLRADPVRLAVWLGLLAWALQSLMEFGLYIPAIAWPAFCFMGWLLGSAPNQFDTRPQAR
jgi:putative inorganic carbon (HCO3(-)) transporter